MIHCEACGTESADAYRAVRGNRERYWEWIDQPPNGGLVNAVIFCDQCLPTSARTAAWINGALNQESGIAAVSLLNEMLADGRPA